MQVLLDGLKVADFSAPSRVVRMILLVSLAEVILKVCRVLPS